MADAIFMALALLVSEKQDYMQKLDRNLPSLCTVKIGQDSMLMVGLTLTLQDVCRTQVSWL